VKRADVINVNLGGIAGVSNQLLSQEMGQELFFYSLLAHLPPNID